MENKNKFKIRSFLVIILLSVISLAGCSSIMDKIAVTKGQLIGNKFRIYSYDYYANKTLSMEGKRVNISTLKSNQESDEDEAKYSSSVLEITINGRQVYQVGNTLIFAEEGLDMVEDFEGPENITPGPGGTFIPIDRYVNDIKNKLGKEKTVIISTPMGIPIGVFEGKKVFATVPKDLPKMTRLNIDGKSLYIHRANYMIIDTDAIN